MKDYSITVKTELISGLLIQETHVVQSNSLFEAINQVADGLIDLHETSFYYNGRKFNPEDEFKMNIYELTNPY